MGLGVIPAAAKNYLPYLNLACIFFHQFKHLLIVICNTLLQYVKKRH
jgi:hypothetical protein